MLRRIGVISIAIAALAAAGALIVTLVFFQTPPPSLATSDRITEAPVTTQDFVDERGVSVAVRPTPDLKIQTPTGGLLSRSDCQPGGTLDSGAFTFRVDGVPLLNLHLRVPLWRDLMPGDRGDDVDSLKEELRRLDFSVSSGASLRWDEIAAIRTLYDRAGLSRDISSIEHKLIVWIPLSSTPVSQCPSQLGTTLTADSVIAVSPGANEVSLQNLPAGLLPGSRTLAVDGVSIPLTDSLTIDPSVDTAPLLDTPTYRSAAEKVSEKEPVTVAGTMSLITGVKVVPIPPASITISSGSNGCVRSGDVTYTVEIVGSQLGRSIVRFESVELPSSISLDPPKTCA